MVILPSGCEAPHEVAGEAKSEEPDDLGKVQCLGEAISAGGAPDHGESTSADGACWGLLSAEARVTEEPGAGKLHAGICAGGASASLPRLCVRLGISSDERECRPIRYRL